MIEIPQVVTIAGIDSSGGAGANADLKTFHNQHVYSASIITGLTAQNTYGVQDILPTPPEFLREEFKSVFSDLEIRAAKTGALFDESRAKTVAAEVRRWQVPNLVVDPVMVAKGGAKLLSDAAVEIVRNELFPLALLVTPNLTEASELVGAPISSTDEMLAAASEIQDLGAKNVLLKGGHQNDSQSTEVTDLVLFEDGSTMWLSSPRIDAVRTHGTGDTLSSYIVANLAKGESLRKILPAAKEFITAAISQTIAVGHGHGPLNHRVEVKR